MSNKIERRLLHDDLIDDVVELPLSSLNTPSNASFFIDGTKITQNRKYSSFPLLFNKPKFEQTDHSIITSKHDQRDRSQLPLSRASSSSLMMSNDERRKEIDRIIKHLYDGKLLSATNDDLSGSDRSESSMHMLNKRATTTTTTTTAPAATTTTVKTDEESKNHDALPVDSDVTSLQRELKEKELDITHLRKEIQELQLENKLLKAKEPSVYSNSYTNNNNETDVLRREKDILKNELSVSQDLLAKCQQQQKQQQNLIINRSNRIEEINLHQKEIFENKLKSYEQQMCILMNENDKLKQNSQQTERLLIQLKRENDELQQKITEAKKRNDELFFQEFHSLRNNLKVLKERNNELFQENLRIQQEHVVWRSSTHEQQQMPSSTSVKICDLDAKHLKLIQDEGPYLSEGSDSTNFLTSVSADRYNTRPSTSKYCPSTIEGNTHHRSTRYSALGGQENTNRNINSIPLSKSFDQNLQFRSSKTKRTAEWNEQNIRSNEDITNYDNDHPTKDSTKSSLSSHTYQSTYPTRRSTATSNESQHCSQRSSNNDPYNQQTDRHHNRGNILTISPKRPYAPLSINDIHLNDIVKFSRPGGKVSKGAVKYIGLLPGKNDQYLGLELEEEESKHDGIYQDQRIFQCKSNKGVFVGFNKVIMAWSGH